MLLKQLYDLQFSQNYHKQIICHSRWLWQFAEYKSLRINLARFTANHYNEIIYHSYCSSISNLICALYQLDYNLKINIIPSFTKIKACNFTIHYAERLLFDSRWSLCSSHCLKKLHPNYNRNRAMIMYCLSDFILTW